MTAPTQESVTQRVCEIPVDFHDGKNKSVARLLKESGYLDDRALLTKESVRSYLRANPRLVNAWKQYSEDQRTSSGWYFTTDDSDVEVGYFDARGRSNVQRYPSKEEACAEYILKEADVIAGAGSALLWVGAGVLLVIALFALMIYKSLH